ncbi:hypothetical protein Hanom_Chr04g00340121 [Helianthus anomalus]
MSLREFVVHYHLYTLKETDTPSTPRASIMPSRSTLCRFWQVIGLGCFGKSNSRVSRIRDPR